MKCVFSEFVLLSCIQIYRSVFWTSGKFLWYTRDDPVGQLIATMLHVYLLQRDFQRVSTLANRFSFKIRIGFFFCYRESVRGLAYEGAPVKKFVDKQEKQKSESQRRNQNERTKTQFNAQKLSHQVQVFSLSGGQ